MNATYPSDEQLNAYLDDELDMHERAKVIAAIEADEHLAARVSRMRQDMDLLALAYAEPPLPGRVVMPKMPGRWYASKALAASLLLLLGGLLGWMSHQPPVTKTVADYFMETNSFDPLHLPDGPILLHVSEMDDDKINLALSKAESILQQSRIQGKPLQLEVVANASGLGMLRDDSPYAERIHILSDQYDNVAFKACGIAMENARLKEGREVMLLPDAEKIPAALPQILKRVKQGWVYLKG